MSKAGYADVNGVYLKNGEYNGVRKYVKEGSNGKAMLYYYNRAAYGHQYWAIDNHAGSCVYHTPSYSESPPSKASDWVVTKSPGVNPCPVLTFD